MQILTDTHTHTAIYSRFSKRVEKNKKIMPEREKHNGLHWAIGWTWREREKERWIPNGPIRAHRFLSLQTMPSQAKRKTMSLPPSLSLNRVPFLILFLFPLSCVLNSLSNSMIHVVIIVSYLPLSNRAHYSTKQTKPRAENDAKAPMAFLPT